MKRILSLVTVAALMAVMMATSVAPAYATVHIWRCIDPDTGAIAPAIGPHMKKDVKADGFTECTKEF